jgi:hypothetical protein
MPETPTTDWRALAHARALNISDADLDRIAPVLESLDAAFRPLARQIPHDVEPAVVLSTAAVRAE